MRKVLLTTSAIVGLTAPAFAADPTAVSDQPYFHHSHPMSWSGSMSIALTNLSTKDSDAATVKGVKRDWFFGVLTDATGGNQVDGSNEEDVLASIENSTTDVTTTMGLASSILVDMANMLSTHACFAITVGTTTMASAVEDIVDDYLGGSHSEAMDYINEVFGNGTDPTASDIADVRDDLKAFQASQDAGAEGVETTASINTSASLGVSMSAGDGWTASTSGTINLSGGSVSAGAMSLSNGMMTISVGKSQHSAAAAVSTVFGMDRALNSNSSDTNLSATMALGGATISVDNEMDGDNLEVKNQTVGIKGSYGSMSYGLGWEADGDLGFSIGTNLGQVGLTVSRVNTGSSHSTGLAASLDLGGGMKLSATNAQNSDGLTDAVFSYSAISRNAAGTAIAYAATEDSIGTTLLKRAVHKSISTVGLSYSGGGTSIGVTYHEKAGTSSGGDNMIASGSMAISPSITLTGSYNKDSALTTIGASGPLGSAGTISALMASSGSSSLTASFKF